MDNSSDIDSFEISRNEDSILENGYTIWLFNNMHKLEKELNSGYLHVESAYNDIKDIQMSKIQLNDNLFESVINNVYEKVKMLRTEIEDHEKRNQIIETVEEKDRMLNDELTSLKLEIEELKSCRTKSSEFENQAEYLKIQNDQLCYEIENLKLQLNTANGDLTVQINEWMNCKTELTLLANREENYHKSLDSIVSSIEMKETSKRSVCELIDTVERFIKEKAEIIKEEINQNQSPTLLQTSSDQQLVKISDSDLNFLELERLQWEPDAKLEDVISDSFAILKNLLAHCNPSQNNDFNEVLIEIIHKFLEILLSKINSPSFRNIGKITNRLLEWLKVLSDWDVSEIGANSGNLELITNIGVIEYSDILEKLAQKIDQMKRDIDCYRDKTKDLEMELNEEQANRALFTEAVLESMNLDIESGVIEYNEILEKLADKVDQMNMDINCYRDNVRDLEIELCTERTTIGLFTETILESIQSDIEPGTLGYSEIFGKISEKMDEMNHDIDCYRDKVKVLEMELSTERISRVLLAETTEKENNDLKNNLGQSICKSEELQLQINNLQIQLNQSDKTISDMNIQMRSNDELNALLKDSNKDLQTSLEKRDMELEQALEDFLKISEELELCKSSLSESNNSLERVQELEKELLDYQTEVSLKETLLKDKCNALENELNDHNVAFEKLLKDKENLLKQDNQLMIRIREFEIQSGEKQIELESVNIRLGDITSKLEYCTNKLSEQELTNENFIRDKELLEFAVNDKETLLRDYEISLQNLAETQDQLKAELLEKDTSLNHLRDQVNCHETTMEVMNKKLRQAEEKVQECKSQSEIATNQLLTFEAELGKRKTDFSTQASALEQLQNELQLNRSSKEESEIALHAKTLELDVATKAINSLQEELAKSNRELNELKFQLESSASASQVIEVLKLELANKKEELAIIEQDLKVSTNNFRTFEHEHELLKQKAKSASQTWQREKVKHHRALSSMEGKYEALETKISEDTHYHSEEVSRLKAEIVKLNLEIESLKTEINNKNLEIHSVKEELKSLESILDHYNELKARYKEKRVVVKDLGEKIANLEKEVADLRATVRTV